MYVLAILVKKTVNTRSSITPSISYFAFSYRVHTIQPVWKINKWQLEPMLFLYLNLRGWYENHTTRQLILPISVYKFYSTFCDKYSQKWQWTHFVKMYVSNICLNTFFCTYIFSSNQMTWHNWVVNDVNRIMNYLGVF